MTYSAVIGIDPGLSGGIAFIHKKGVIKTIPIPTTERDVDITELSNWIEWITTPNSIIIENLKAHKEVVAYIEAVHAMPGQGVSSTFKFGYITGILHGVIRTLGISLKLVTPQTWKKEILAGTAKDKQAAIDYCLRVYPDVSLLATSKSKKYHSGMADALCIAEYGYRKENIKL